jgi:hypothetical protein
MYVWYPSLLRVLVCQPARPAAIATIETLERGRTSIWSEMRGLHTFIASDSPLAEKFAAVSRDLEELTMSATLGEDTIAGEAESKNDEGMDSFGLLVVKYRRLFELFTITNLKITDDRIISEMFVQHDGQKCSPVTPQNARTSELGALQSNLRADS